MNNGEDTVCCVCGKEGNTAHDLTWDEYYEGWACEDCETMELTAEPPLPDGDVDHDEEDRRAYNEERCYRPRASEY